MKCPHCLVEVNPNFIEVPLTNDKEAYRSVFTMNCPNLKCGKMIVDLASGEPNRNNHNQIVPGLSKISKRQTVKPFASSRPLVPPEVDHAFATDYNEHVLF